MKILINDGIHPSGKKILEEAGYTLDMNKIDQADLMTKLNAYDGICVRSATKVRKELIEASPNLKVVGRGGVGLDNIDVDFARSKGIGIINTPAASSRSVAELAFAHLFSLARFLHQSNKTMPERGDQDFNLLKKSYSKGFELEGKLIGIIGLGKIGLETAGIAAGLGMEILAVDPYVDSAEISFGPQSQPCKITLETVEMEDMLSRADIVSVHIPFGGKAVLSESEFSKMKNGVIIINASRGGTIDEDALLNALNNEKVAAAGIDVFVGEPSPRKDLLSHPRVSLSPHTGASTNEAQEKIGIELAKKIIAFLENQ